MSTVEEEIVALLEAHAPLVDLVEDRIYPQMIAQGVERPAVSYFVVTGQREQCLRGPSDLENSRFQFDCYAQQYLQAKAVARAVTQAIEAATTLGVVAGIKQDLFDPDTRLHRVLLEMSVWRKDPQGSPA